MSPARSFRKRSIALIILLVLLVGIPLLFTRSFFLAGVVLPMVSNATGMEISAARIQIGSTVVITDLDIQGHPDVKILKVSTIELVPVWSRLIGGEIAFEVIRMEEPVALIELSEAASDSGTMETSEESETSAPPHIDIGEFTIQGGSFSLILEEQQYVKIMVEHLTLNDVGNSSTATLHGEVPILLLDGDVRDADDLPVITGRGHWTGDLHFALSDSLTPTSLMGDSTLEWKSEDPDLPAVTLTLKPDLEMDLDAKTLSLQALDARALTEGTERLVVELTQPTTLDWNVLPPTFGDTSLHVHLNRSWLQELPFSSLLPVQEGEVECKADLTIRESGSVFSGTLTASAQNLNGQLGELSLENASLTLEARASGSLEQVVVDTASLSLTNQGAPLGGFSGSGSFSPSELTGDATLEYLTVYTASLPIALPDSPLLQGFVLASGRVTRDAEGIIHFRAETSLQPDESFSRPPPPLPLSLQAVGQLEESSLLIRTGQFSWGVEGTDAGMLRFTASGDWSDASAPRGDLQLEADRIDLDPLLALLPTEESETVSEPPAASEPETASLPALPLGPSSVSLLAGQIRVKGLTLEDVDVHVALGPTSVVLHPGNLNIQGSHFSTSGSADWTKDRLELSLSSSLSPLEIGPVVDTLYPAAKGAIQGTFSYDLHVERPFPDAEPDSSLKGSVTALLDQGSVRLFAPFPDAPEGLLQTQRLLESIIRAMASALAVPPEQLLDPPVETLLLQAELAGQELQLKNFRAENPEFRLQANGSLPFRTDAIGDTTVQDIPVALGVNTNIAKRIRIYREDRLEEDKIMLPPLMDIRGTLAQPEIDVRKRAIAGLVITGVTERNSTGNEDVDKVLGILGGLLSGEGPPPTPTPRP